MALLGSRRIGYGIVGLLLLGALSGCERRYQTSIPMKLDTDRAVPESENAAGLYAKALVEMEAARPAVDFGDGLPLDSKHTLEALRLFREGSKRTVCAIAPESGVREHPILEGMQEAATLLIGFARWKSEQGDWKGGLEEASVVKRLSVHASQLRSGKKYAAGIEGRALLAWWATLKAHPTNKQALATGREWLDDLPEFQPGDTSGHSMWDLWHAKPRMAAKAAVGLLEKYAVDQKPFPNALPPLNGKNGMPSYYGYSNGFTIEYATDQFDLKMINHGAGNLFSFNTVTWQRRLALK